jgi:hypothetical protein
MDDGESSPGTSRGAHVIGGMRSGLTSGLRILVIAQKVA